ncbi:PREDICTED: ribonuclease Oy [Vollenhovia emeryi]|uniref:ribonuclease Oy n=1 Tax=Vollenhovia emeryi TaxID=411798 RepID=UPI0005F43D35|nr:PREDICTED: ribonuclease Oy [Vollenhovia emeryi]
MERFLSSRMWKYSIASCIVLLYLLCVTHGRAYKQQTFFNEKDYKHNQQTFNNRNKYKQQTFNNRKEYKQQTSNEFDVLIFTQQWPFTACLVWTQDSSTHSCVLPNHDSWTIHGIWPTKYNTLGPQFCNNTSKFDPSFLKPIEKELTENWLDIHKGSKPYSFWKHEWDKHGTCAVAMKPLDNEFNYFQTGLKLLKEYNMMDVLAKANILPGNRYKVEDMLTKIEKILTKKGQIMCIIDKETQESYVMEIRICFDKTLQLIDCNGIYHFPTNCNRSKPIIYPSNTTEYNVIKI